MIIEKLHRYASLLFLLALIFTQGLVYVGTQAARQARENLRVVFLNQELALPIASGAEPILRAIVANSKYEDFSQVYFTLINQNSGQELSFFAQLQPDGSWLSDSAWQTAGSLAGDYILYATAQVSADGEPEATLNSDPIAVKIAAAEEEQQASSGDDDQTEDADTVDNNTTGGQNDNLEISTSTSSLTLSVLSPDSETLSEEVDILVELSEEISSTSTVGFIFDYQGEIQNIVLTKQASRQYGRTINTVDFADGTYQWIFYSQSGNTVTNLLAYEVVIDNASVPVETELMINFEAPTDPIIGNILNGNFSTNFLAKEFRLELVSKNNAAISTGQMIIPKTDGFGWIKTVVLGDIFVDGQYDLILTATDQESGDVVEKIYELTFDILEKKQNVDFATLTVALENPGTNLRGTVILRAEINQDNVNGEFVFTSTVNTADSYTVQSLGAGKQSVASVDTGGIPDGNYQLAWQILDNNQIKLKSDNVLVTVFNSENDQATSTEEFVDDENNEAQIEDQSIAIGRDMPDCALLGVNDAGECRRLQAELSGTLDMICISQAIYEPAACEDYLNRLIVSSQCQSQGIIDRESCKDYWLEKYSARINCRLNEPSQCTTVLREQYLNRMVSAAQKADAIEEALATLEPGALTVGSFRNLLESKQIKNMALPLASAEAKVLALRSLPSRTLESAQVLTMRPMTVLTLDRDGDGLPDDLESYYGADIDAADTDQDGYLDGEEIKNGYDPISVGALPESEAAASALARSAFADIALEQPLLEPVNTDQSLVLSKISKVAGLTQFSGVAPAYQWINLFIYSDVPLVSSVRADSEGRWSYILSEDLADGYHQMFLAIHDEEGRIVSQSKQNYFKIAQDVVESPVATTQENTAETGPSFSKMMMYYIIGALVVLLGGLSVFLYVRYRRRSNEGHDFEQSPPKSPTE